MRKFSEFNGMEGSAEMLDVSLRKARHEHMISLIQGRHEMELESAKLEADRARAAAAAARRTTL